MGLLLFGVAPLQGPVWIHGIKRIAIREIDDAGGINDSRADKAAAIKLPLGGTGGIDGVENAAAVADIDRGVGADSGQTDARSEFKLPGAVATGGNGMQETLASHDEGEIPQQNRRAATGVRIDSRAAGKKGGRFQESFAKSLQRPVDAI